MHNMILSVTVWTSTICDVYVSMVTLSSSAVCLVLQLKRERGEDPLSFLHPVDGEEKCRGELSLPPTLPPPPV